MRDIGRDFQFAAEQALGEAVSIQSTTDAITGSKNFILTLAASRGLNADQQLMLSETLSEAFPDNQVDAVSINVVDPVIGREFLLKSLLAVGFASVLMIVYVGLRFKKISGWSAGVMAVVALIHDVLIVFAVFIVFRIPLNDNFIAVVLTILGYSLNDTIVIYDRVRENKRIYGQKLSTAELMNKSINQSFTRTLATTVTTVTALLTVSLVALFYNVSSILSFSFPMVAGMLSGVYSSLGIAGPLWVLWQQRRESAQTPKKA
jgi:preprotein translocase SecF subunit